MREITITIGKDGKAKVDASGFVGGECLDATRAIEAALSSRNAESGREVKPEMYAVTPEQVTA